MAAASLSPSSSDNAAPVDSVGADSGGSSGGDGGESAAKFVNKEDDGQTASSVLAEGIIGAEGRGAGRRRQAASSSLAQLPPLLQDSTPMAAQRGGRHAATVMLDSPGVASGMQRGGIADPLVPSLDAAPSEYSSSDAAPSDTPLLGSVQPRTAGERAGLARASSSSFLGGGGFGGVGGGGLAGGLALGSSISVAASMGSAANSIVNIDDDRSFAVAARARPSAGTSAAAATRRPPSSSSVEATARARPSPGTTARPPSSSSAASRLLLASFQHQAERGAERVQRLGRIVSALAGDGGAIAGGGGGDPEIRQQVGAASGAD